MADKTLGQESVQLTDLCVLSSRTAAAWLQVWENTPGCGEAPFLDSVWTAIDEALALQDCDVYSYKSDGETDPFGAHTLWASFHGD